MPKQAAEPVLKCDCGTAIPISGRKIGDSVPCPSCRALRVVLRSKVDGEVPAAGATPRAISDRLPEVQESLKRIRMRQAGAASRGIALYPQWVVLVLGAFGFYLPAILAGQNLLALGLTERGRRLQVAGVVSYLVVGGSLLAAYARWGEVLAAPGSALLLQLELGGLLLVPVIGALVFGLAGRREVGAAFEAGARPASALVPALVGFLLVVAQTFVVQFVDIWVRG